MTEVRRVAVVSTGVIGASWAAHFLARGLDVVATDPAPDAEERLRADVAAHWPVLERIGLAEGASLSRLTFTADPAEAVADADFVQENGPEREDVKHALFAVLDAAARPDVVLASSSSGLLPSVIARGAPKHPERVLIGHPFNPPHLIPLVEVVPGERTSDDAVETAMAFYAAVGKRPIRVRQEVPGHIANRLQAALWQEAYFAGRAGRRDGRGHRHRHLPGPRPALGHPRAVREPAPLRRTRRPGARPGAPRTADGEVVARPALGHPDPGADRHAGRRGGGRARGRRPGHSRRAARRRAAGPARREGRRRPALTATIKDLDTVVRFLVSMYLLQYLEEEDRPWQHTGNSTSQP